MADHKSRKQFNIRLKELKNTRQPHEAPWKDIRDYEVPNRGNFEEDKGTEGQRKDLKIYNGTPSLSARTLQAGMKAGVTSSSRPWFREAMANRDLMERSDVREYVHGVEEVLYQIYNQSNFYTMASLLYLEFGAFGIGAMAIKADFEDVARFDTYTIGEYWAAINARSIVDVLYRMIWKTPVQLIEDFGKDNVSQNVKAMAESGSTDKLVKIIHAVEPNDDRIPNMIDAKNKAYRSVYYEEGSLESDKDFLSVSGFDRFPYVVPRWSTNGHDPYGTDQPGILALGDAKELMSGTFDKKRGLQKNMNPPLQAPSDLKNQRIMNVPGGVTFYNQFSGSGNFGVKSLYENRVPLKDIIEDLNVTERRIRSAYYVDLFLTILANDRPQDMKAEVAFQIDKERLLMLGPVLENLNDEFLDPLNDRVFELAEDAGVLPEAPADLRGENLKVEYVSSLAKAQKSSTISNMERFVSLGGAVDALIPGTIDKVDGDKVMDEAAEVLDIPPKIARSDEDVEAVRVAKQQIKNQQIALQAGEVAAKTAKDLANAPVGTGNMLEQLVGAQP